MGKVCQLRTIASDLWCLSFRQKTLFTNQPEWRRLYLQSLATEKCWDWDIFRLTHEDKTERSVSFRQETRKKTFLQSYWTKKNTEIRIIVGWHMMIRESFWHKTLFTNQPNEDVSRDPINQSTQMKRFLFTITGEKILTLEYFYVGTWR